MCILTSCMYNGQQPIFILKEGTTRTSGKGAQSNNIAAAKAVADAVRSMAHSDSYNAPMPAGENLAMGMGTFTCGDYTGPYNQNCATHHWYEEYACWGAGDDGWQDPTCTIGHLTAMIWKKTTKIGCASSGNYFACQYGAEPPNFNSGSCPTNECVERKNYDEASCKAGTSSILATGTPGLGGLKGGDSGVVWKGLLAWAVVSVICFAIFSQLNASFINFSIFFFNKFLST